MSSSRIFREAWLVLLLAGALKPPSAAALDPNRTIAQYVHDRWGAREGFPGGAVNSIAQTSDGYLWIASDNGLVRFDGLTFRLLEPGNTPSLPAGHVLELITDGEGVLWVRMESPYLLRYRGGLFEQSFPLDLTQPGATTMAKGMGGSVLVAPPGTPLRYSGEKFIPVAAQGAVGGLAISIAETQDAVWIGMRDSGLFAVRNGQGTAVAGLPDAKVNALLRGHGRELWIGTDSGLARWDGEVTLRGVPAALAHRQVLVLAGDRDSNVWCVTTGGLFRIDPAGAVSAGVPPHPGSGPLRAIFEDREGNLWLGGPGGLERYRAPPFLSYAVDGRSDDSGPLYADAAGRTWFAPVTGGLAWLRGSERREFADAGLSGDVVYSITGGPGEVWAGRRLGGLTQLSEKDGEFHLRTYSAADGLASSSVYAVHRSRDGSVWAGTLNGGVSRVRNGRITTYTTASGLSSDAVTAIEETPDGVIWVATAGGLQAFANGVWRGYGGPDGLPPGPVNCLTSDPDGVLWVGTSAGLFYFRAGQARPASGVPETLRGKILGITADTRGKLWIATEMHLISIARAGLMGAARNAVPAREFGTGDGLVSTKGIRRHRTVTTDRSGRVWFSLHGGISVVDPARLAALAPALPHIGAVVVDGRALDTALPIRFSSDRRRVAFSFMGLSLAVPDRVRYRYRLDGYDRDWSTATETREAGYTNLEPRAYRFRVMASNTDGLWDGPETAVAFEVLPQVWQNWWFRALAISLLGASVFAAFRLRLSGVRAAMNLRLEERLAERTRIAQELHDTLLQGFLSASMHVHVAADSLPDDSAARPRLTRALALMQQVIDEGRNAVRGLRATDHTTLPLEAALSQIKQEMGAPQELEYRVIVEGRQRPLHPMLRDEVYRIAREALTNAFRHSKASHIEVELNYAAAGFRLFVRDDGTGIDAKILRTGLDGHWGLVGIRERADRIGAQLHVFSRPTAGTEIELDVPSDVAFVGARSGRWKWLRRR
ncbi:MAG: two-component regulator propeller domain-containing protein [Candidatus Solibacter sp.]